MSGRIFGVKEIKNTVIHIRWRLQLFSLLGFLFGVVLTRAPFSIEVLMGLLSWLLLCSGVVVFNSYYDEDKRPVAGLEKPPVVSSTMLVGAWILKLAGLVIAISLNWLFVILYGVAIILSFVYSHRSLRAKANGYIAVLFNFISGAMTFLAAASFSSPTLNVLAGGSSSAGLFLAAIYLMMQVHQGREDNVRGYSSIMVMHGRARTILSAIILISLAGVGVITSLISAHFIWMYSIIGGIYFFAIITASMMWLVHAAGQLEDYRNMSRLTTSIVWSANLILIAIYMWDIVLR